MVADDSGRSAATKRCSRDSQAAGQGEGAKVVPFGCAFKSSEAWSSAVSPAERSGGRPSDGEGMVCIFYCARYAVALAAATRSSVRKVPPSTSGWKGASPTNRRQIRPWMQKGSLSKRQDSTQSRDGHKRSTAVYDRSMINLDHCKAHEIRRK